MKKRILILLIFGLFIFNGYSQIQDYNLVRENDFGHSFDNAMSLFNEYKSSGNINNLDSSIYLANRLLVFYGDDIHFVDNLLYHKSVCYLYKHDYEQALYLAQSIKVNMRYHTYYYELYKLRLYAMIHEKNGDLVKRNIYIKEIVVLLDEFCNDNDFHMETFFEFDAFSAFVIIQYYYYKGFLVEENVLNAEMRESINDSDASQRLFKHIQLLDRSDFMKETLLYSYN